MALLASTAGCYGDSMLEVQVRWLAAPEDRPPPGAVFAHAAVTGPSGTTAAVTPWGEDTRLELRGLQPGPDQVLEVALRETEDPSSAACCRARSEPFDLSVTDVRQVDLFLDVQPVLQIDQSRVSWVRAPIGRETEQALPGGFVVPPGPRFAVAPADPLSGELTIPREAFRLVGDITPSRLELVDESGRPVGEMTADANGDWLRAGASVGLTDPGRLSVRAALSDGRESPPVRIERVWYVVTSAEPVLPTTTPARLRRVAALEAGPEPAAPPLSRAETGAPDGRAVSALDRPPWRRVGVPLARAGAAMAFDAARGLAVMFGGRELDAYGDTWTWDGQRWGELVGVGGPSPRHNHAMAYDPVRERVVLFGGADSGPRDDVWEWDGQSWTEIEASRAPPAREGAAMAYDPNLGVVVLHGGTDGVTRLDDLWTWDGTQWRERVVEGARPSARQEHGLVFDAEWGRLVLVAGFDDTTYSGETWSFDGERWTRHDDLPARSGMVVVYDREREEVLAYGGFFGAAFEAATRTFRQGTWRERAPATPAPARSDAAAAYDSARGRVVVFSGYGGAVEQLDALEDTWEWDGETWHERVTTSTAPRARFGAADSYDLRRGEGLLFGGFGDGMLGDTWRWTARGWVRQAVPGPAPRVEAAMAYDAARERHVLFGGATDGDTLDDTWEWDGQAWRRLSPSISPTARAGHRLVYDRARQVVLLFGGVGGDLLGDTWTWDGQTWRRESPPEHPSPRASPAMAYDEARGRVVLFGGDTSLSALDPGAADTWEWDGQTWTHVPTAPSPLPRTRHRLTYDRRRQRVVLFGGGARGFTWEWDGETWSNVTPAATIESRRDPTLFYDVERGHVVLFGGVAPDVTARDDTWLRSSGDPSFVQMLTPPLPFTPAQIDEVQATLHCSSSAVSDPSAVAEIWSAGAWSKLGEVRLRAGFTPEQARIDAAITDMDAARAAAGPDGLAVRCRAASSTVTASGRLDYAELRIRYVDR